MIIVEGPDGAGKTTLVRTLMDEFGLKEGERGTADRSKLYEVTVSDTFNALGQAVQGRADTLPKVWDRLYYSELVYADLVGRPVEFSPEQQTHIQRVLEAMRVPIILCMPPLRTVVNNTLAVDQMAGVKDNIEAIYDRYGQLHADGVFPDNTILYDYTDPEHAMDSEYQTLSEILEDVGDYLDFRGRRSWT